MTMLIESALMLFPLLILCVGLFIGESDDESTRPD